MSRQLIPSAINVPQHIGNLDHDRPRLLSILLKQVGEAGEASTPVTIQRGQ